MIQLAWASKRGKRRLENCLRSQWTKEEPHRYSQMSANLKHQNKFQEKLAVAQNKGVLLGSRGNYPWPRHY